MYRIVQDSPICFRVQYRKFLFWWDFYEHDFISNSPLSFPIKFTAKKEAEEFILKWREDERVNSGFPKTVMSFTK